ncbi:MAG TPA: PAS domain-containing protein [Phototrophicaceae bacterium]|nr:PAS domain-containing protein [Phototrophicaceae bacterium]
MDLAAWLETNREKILANSMALELDELEPLADGMLYPIWEALLNGLQHILANPAEQAKMAIQVARYGLEVRVDLPGFIHSVNLLRRAITQQLFQAAKEIPDLLAGLEPCTDFFFFSCQVASTTLGSGAGAKIAEERSQLWTLVETLPALIYIKDQDSRFTLANTTQVQWVGAQSAEELIGTTDADWYPREMAAKFQQDEQQLMVSGEPIIGLEEKVCGPDGDEYWFQSTKVPLRDNGGNITGLIGLGFDITERKRAAEWMQSQERIIEAQRQALQQLSTPIIPILEGVIVMPLIGGIDSDRAQDIMRTLLRAITQHQAHLALVDLTGVAVVDSSVADYLNRTIQAARLKGVRTIITGLSDAIAEVIVDLGLDWSGIETVRDLQTGLKVALDRLGVLRSQNSNRKHY